MKAIIQRVHSAHVEVDSEVVGKISKGYLIYICFESGDDKNQLQELTEKIHKLRIFEDDKGKMNLSLSQVKGQILSISQFTLSWDGKKGHRPSFDKSMPPTDAKIYYKLFNDSLRSYGHDVQMGKFGAEMQVFSQNDGPVTFILNR